MQDDSSIELRMHKLDAFSQDELEFIFSRIKGTLTLRVPCPSIGSTQSYQDVASDLLDALFIGESIAAFCKDISYYEDWDKNQTCTTINFVFVPKNPSELAKKLYWLSYIFEEEEENETTEEVREAIFEFQDSIGLFERETYHFPVLLNVYFANHVLALEEDSDEFEDISELDIDDYMGIHSYIHGKYGYIRSFYQENSEHDLYYFTNDNSWIFFSNTPIEISALEQMMDIYRIHLFRPLELQEASIVVTRNFETIVFNQVEAVAYPFAQITKAQKCIAEIYRSKKGISLDEV